jgi:tRNA-binding EMAP/Myf-like protein
MLTTKLDNPNYRAKIVKIDRLEPHPNADKLLITIVDFQRIIVGLNTQIGDLFVYFPLESQINSEFVSFFNGYSSLDLNRDKTQKGFFSNKSRVKATRLRGELSEGYLHPLSSFNEFLAEKQIKFQVTEKEVGIEFDSVDNLLVCQKYIVKEKGQPNLKKQKEAKVLDRLVDGQLRLHLDTESLKKNVHKINPEDLISISYKLHGTNFTFAKVLCKKKLNLFEKILKKCGVNIVDKEYDWCAASRRVVKNIEGEKEHKHFYEYDLWTEAMHKIKDKIQNGYTLYGEIVGHLPSGSAIQGLYDYGCKPNEYKIFVFRITYTTPEGNVIELTRPQIDRYCAKYELDSTPLFYYGRARDLYTELDTKEHWHESFLNNLIKDYNEKDCFMCRNKVPEEGIVLTKDGLTFEAFKLKSMKFLEEETKLLDKEQTNIEDEQ